VQSHCDDYYARVRAPCNHYVGILLSGAYNLLFHLAANDHYSPEIENLLTDFISNGAQDLTREHNQLTSSDLNEL